MHRILISFCILFAALSVKAQTISGIRIDGGNNPIVVYVGGSQMCLPTTTCFVANLKPGYYTIDVYASRYSRPEERPWKGQKLYSERVYFNGKGVKDISADRDNSHPESKPDYNEGHNAPNRGDQNDNTMNDRLFNTFYKSVEKEISDANRIKMIDTALATSDFTSEQCLRLSGLVKFDNDRMIIMRKMYPQIVDKQAFFIVFSLLKYSSSKETMNTFIKNYKAKAR